MTGLLTLLQASPGQGGLEFVEQGRQVATVGLASIGCPELVCHMDESQDAEQTMDVLRRVAASSKGKPSRLGPGRVFWIGDDLIKLAPGAAGSVQLVWWSWEADEPPPWL